MTDPTPPPHTPNLISHKITQGSPFNGHYIDPLPHFSDHNWAEADTVWNVAMSGCNDDRLKACVVAALSSVWGVQEMYPEQIGDVSCLLHPIRPYHLAIIVRRTFFKCSVSLSGRLSSSLFHYSHCPPMWCQISGAPTRASAPLQSNILASYMTSIKEYTMSYWNNAKAFFAWLPQGYLFSCHRSSS